MIKCGCEKETSCHCSDGVVCLKNVSFMRGAKTIVEDITFCIDEGVFLGVIGPNGGGKTTLLRLILGTLQPHHGRIEVFGVPPVSLGRRRTLISYVPQHYDIDQNFPASGLDVVLMGATAKLGLLRRPSRETRRQAQALMDRVGVGSLANRPIGRMSGGQQQRTFIARALISEPRLLLLDEPTVGLDSSGQQQFLQLLNGLRDEFKLTVIMVSHDVGQLAFHADQMACINNRLHWHDRAQLLDEQILRDVYNCELDAYKVRVRELASDEHRHPSV